MGDGGTGRQMLKAARGGQARRKARRPPGRKQSSLLNGTTSGMLHPHYLLQCTSTAQFRPECRGCRQMDHPVSQILLQTWDPPRWKGELQLGLVFTVHTSTVDKFNSWSER